MLFNSYEFIFLFLPLTLFGYLLLLRSGLRELAMAWLVVASLLFYGWWNPAYLGLIVLSMAVNYTIGSILSRTRHRSLLAVGVIFNLGLLGYFKYANFLVDNINKLVETGWILQTVILPLAISFFSFQQIAYLVDAWRGETREYNFLHYALFITFFPQLIAGPIVHHREMMPQFMKSPASGPGYTEFAIGLTIFVMGLFKKVVIADTFSPAVTGTFASVATGHPLSFFEAWYGVLGYSFQLYFDFSGYSDMAIGLALLFGIRLPLNFDSPYQSRSIIEFWRRWHMTLSRFLRDYLYIPLGGNRRGKLRRHVNLMITMLLGGLWHGAAWTFVFWGGLHGIYLVINHAWHYLLKRLRLNFQLSPMVARFITLSAVIMAWVFFRADSIPSALRMFDSMFTGSVVWPEEARHQLGPLADVFANWGMHFSYTENFNGLGNIVGMLIAVLFVLYVPNVHQLMQRYSVVLEPPPGSWLRWRPTILWGMWTALLAVITVLKLGQVSEFLYFQF